jgi:hypothetical protein
MSTEQGSAAAVAGTTAGDAWDEIRAPESREAEAEVDACLESLLVTDAARTAADEPSAGLGKPGHHPAGIWPEQARGDRRMNQAGSAGRLERTDLRQ